MLTNDRTEIITTTEYSFGTCIVCRGISVSHFFSLGARWIVKCTEPDCNYIHFPKHLHNNFWEYPEWQHEIER
jgi:hypothetical protein